MVKANKKKANKKKVNKKKVIQGFSAKVRPYRLNNSLYLEKLKSTFEHLGIPSVYYSLNGYSEDAICIEYNNNSWIVYNGERGNKYNINKYKNIQDACDNLILRLSESEEERKQIQNIFENNLKKYGHIIPQNQITIIKGKGHISTPSDTNSLNVQSAVLTTRTLKPTKHSKENPKEHYSCQGMLKAAGRRRDLLKHLKKKDSKKYHNS